MNLEPGDKVRITEKIFNSGFTTYLKKKTFGKTATVVKTSKHGLIVGLEFKERIRGSHTHSMPVKYVEKVSGFIPPINPLVEGDRDEQDTH